MPLRDFGTVVKERRAGINNCYTLGELSANMWVPEGGDTQSSIVKTATQKSAVQKAGFNWTTGNEEGQMSRRLASDARRRRKMDDVNFWLDNAEEWEKDGDGVAYITDEPSMADALYGINSGLYMGHVEDVDDARLPQQYADVAQGADASAKLQAIIEEYGPEMVQNALASFGKSAVQKATPAEMLGRRDAIASNLGDSPAMWAAENDADKADSFRAIADIDKGFWEANHEHAKEGAPPIVPMSEEDIKNDVKMTDAGSYAGAAPKAIAHEDTHPLNKGAESGTVKKAEEGTSESSEPDTFSQVVKSLHDRGYTNEQIGNAFISIVKSAINGSNGDLETAFSAIQKSVSQPDEAPVEEAPAEEAPAEPTETVQ